MWLQAVQQARISPISRTPRHTSHSSMYYRFASLGRLTHHPSAYSRLAAKRWFSESARMLPLPPIACAKGSFEEAASQGHAFVDKTHLLRPLLRGRNRLFSHFPRGFGKTWLVQMLQAMCQGRYDLFTVCFTRGGVRAGSYSLESSWQLFSDPHNFPSRHRHSQNTALGQEYASFGDAAEAKFCSDFMKPFIHLDLANVTASKGHEVFSSQLTNELAEKAEEERVSILTISPELALMTLVRNMRTKHTEDVIVLIDNYDTPVTEALDANGGQCEKDVEEIRRITKGLVTALKRHTGASNQFVMGETLLFSGLDEHQPSDTAWSGADNNTYGYTWTEIEMAFGKHLDVIAAGRGVSRRGLRAELEHVCGGWSHVGAGNDLITLLDPTDVNENLTALQKCPTDTIQSRWANAAAPDCLLRVVPQEMLLRLTQTWRRKEADTSGKGRWIQGNALDKMNHCSVEGETKRDDDKILGLLLQSGYLSVKEIRHKTEFRVAIPNAGVAECLEKALRSGWHTGAG